MRGIGQSFHKQNINSVTSEKDLGHIDASSVLILASINWDF